MSNFAKSLQFVLNNEGGLTNDPDDSGGITNLGLTKEDLSEFYGGRSISDAEIENLTPDIAALIYKKFYWDEMSLDQVSSDNVATVIFDASVNQGVPTISRYVQIATGVAVDGVIGPITIAAIEKISLSDLIYFIYNKSKAHYKAIVAANPTQAKFLQGWLNRINQYLELIN